MADCLRGPVDRASASGAEGRGFESRRRHKKVRCPSGVRGTTGTGPMWRVPAASTLSWHSKRLRVVAMAGGARHIRAGGWRPASGWTCKPAYRRVVQMAARRSLEPYVAGSSPAPPANRSLGGRLARPAGSCHPSARLSAGQGRRQSHGMVPTDSRHSVVGEPVVPIADPQVVETVPWVVGNHRRPLPNPAPMLVLRQGRYGVVGCDA